MFRKGYDAGSGISIPGINCRRATDIRFDHPRNRLALIELEERRPRSELPVSLLAWRDREGDYQRSAIRAGPQYNHGKSEPDKEFDARRLVSYRWRLLHLFNSAYREDCS